VLRRAISAWLRARSRTALIGFGVLMLITVGLLVLAWRTEGSFVSELSVNLGAGFLTLALGYVFLDPLFEQARRGAVEERPYFDHELFSLRVAASRRGVQVLETWTGLLEDRHRTAFLDALRIATGNGVPVRILLLDPDSQAALQRAEELDPVDVQGLIRDNLRHLHTVPPAGSLEVRVYDASVSESLYRWDDSTLIARLPRDQPAYDTTQHEARVTHPWAASALERFEELWHHTSTRPLSQYMLLPVTVLLDGAALGDHGLPYLAREDEPLVVDGSVMVAELTDHGARTLRLRSAGRVYRPTRVPDADGLTPAFDGKYGPAERRILLRLDAVP
jgi:hypothetical protein